MLSLNGLTKRYGDRRVLDDVGFEVPRGVVCGLLGHNGAGKSTLVGILLGHIHADAGSVRIGAYDAVRERAAALRRVGAIFEAPAFHDYLSGARNLQLLAAYSGGVDAARLREVVRFVGLEDRIDDRVAAYSHGMRRRLALAQALLPDPELLVLDEPGDGLDPEGIHEMRQLVLQLQRERGMTILFSSHALAEVQQVCSHLAVLRAGRLLFAGDWRATGILRRRWRVAVDRQSDAESGLRGAGLVEEFLADGSGVPAAGVDTDAVVRWLVAHGFRIEAVAPLEPSLEDFYLDLLRTGVRA